MSKDGRNPDGTFKKGNKIAKLDWTKEDSKHMAKSELNWAVKQCTELTYKQLVDLKASSKLEDESLFTHTVITRALAGDFKAIQWIWEMAIGKPKQTQEISNPEGKQFQLCYSVED